MFRDFIALETIVTFLREDEAVEELKQGGFAASVGTLKHDGFSAAYIKIDIAQGDKTIVCEADFFKFYDRLIHEKLFLREVCKQCSNGRCESNSGSVPDSKVETVFLMICSFESAARHCAVHLFGHLA